MNIIITKIIVEFMCIVRNIALLFNIVLTSLFLQWLYDMLEVNFCMTSLLVLTI